MKEGLLESKCLIKCHNASVPYFLFILRDQLRTIQSKRTKKKKGEREGCELTMFGLAIVGEILNPSSMSCFGCVQVTKSERKSEGVSR